MTKSSQRKGKMNETSDCTFEVFKCETGFALAVCGFFPMLITICIVLLCVCCIRQV